MVDPDYARNYWRKVFVESSNGRFTNKDFDDWFPGKPVGDPFKDELSEAFDQMIEACAGGQFGRPERKIG